MYKINENGESFMECTLYLTDCCNLKCSYCYEGELKKSNSLDESTLETALDYIVSINPEGEKISLNLFGGEPLLKKDLVHKLLELVKNKYENIFNYSMTTNCTLIDEDIINLFKKHKFSIRASIDGDEYTHNLNRRSIDNNNKYETILSNILKLKDAQINMSIRMTITKNNIHLLYKNLLFFYELGFMNFCLGLNFFENWEDEYLEELDNQLSELEKFYVEKMKINEDITIDIFDGKITSIIGHREPKFCCAGSKKHIVIGTCGDIYPCNMVAYDNKWNIGNVKSGINSSIFNHSVKQSVCKNEICDKCDIKSSCHGRKCGFLNYKSTQYLNKSSESLCKIEKIVYKHNRAIVEELYNYKNAKRMNTIISYFNDNNIEFSKEFKSIMGG